MSRKLLVVLAIVGGMTLLVCALVVTALVFRSVARPGVPNVTVLELDLEKAVVEDHPDELVARFILRNTSILRHLVDALHRGAEDDRVVGVVARIGSADVGLAAIQELRDAVRHFRASGKPALAWAETFGEFSPGNAAYYLASAFDEIHLLPSGDVGFTGLNADAEFFRGVFDKYGAIAEMDHRHEYKNAMNTFTEKKLTGAHRESLESILSSLFDQMTRGIAEGRGLSAAEVVALADQGPFLGPEALAAGLVDSLAYRDEIYGLLESRFGKRARYLAPDDYLHRAGSAFGTGDRIALVIGDGNVTRGESGYSSGPFGSSTTMGSDTVTKALRLAIDDSRVKAILFRVNSPGGSYVASDAIRREVVRAREKGKPVVVSMGNLAASGGYFVSMNADAIVAHPATLTGSIGVLGGKLVARGFFERFGVTYDNVKTSANATMFSPVHSYSETEWSRLQAWLDRVYEDFTSKAADGRALPLDSLLTVAKGRVWTGEDAHAVGLVDTLGGYDVALAVVRDVSGIPEDAPVRVVRYPSPASLGQLLLERGFVRGPGRLERVALALAEPFAAALVSLGFEGTVGTLGSRDAEMLRRATAR